MKYVTKSTLDKVNVSELSSELPNLKKIKESKAVTIGKWLTNIIESKKIKPNSLLPTKPDLAYILGVSIGTIQNALRYVEDLGYVESKQCIGTIVKDKEEAGTIRKLTSKREIAIKRLKNYIKSGNFETGEFLPSSRILAYNLDCSANTVRLALDYLASQGILEHKFKNGREFYSDRTGWIIKSLDFPLNNISENESNTLVEKVEKELRDYITDNFKSGDKLPAHAELSNKLSVSIKTIHDALKSLIDQGILLAKRGKYGTTISRMPDDKNIPLLNEKSIFATANDTAFYYYEKTQNNIKKMITENYKIGDKLPSIRELSKNLDLSPNTIRKALYNLSKEGYIQFSRGRYGGTFVIDMPETNEESYKWISVNLNN